MSSFISTQTGGFCRLSLSWSVVAGWSSKGVRLGFVLEAEAGLAFPTIVTGKVGVGIQRFAGGPSGTLGLRLWPLHVYYQQSIPTKRCERTLSERAQRRLQRRGKTRNNLRCSDWYFTLEGGTYGSISFDSVAIISVGHRLFFD